MPSREHPARAPCARRRSRRSAARPSSSGSPAATRTAHARDRPGVVELDARARERAARRTARTCRASAARRVRRRRASARSTPAAASAPSSSTAALGEPDRAEVRRRRWARHRLPLPLRDLVDAVGPVDGAYERCRRRRPRRRASSHAAAVEPRGGGDRRSLRPEAHDVLAREHARARCARCGRRARGRRLPTARALLPAERAAVRERRRRARRRARTTTRRARGTRARPNRWRAATPPAGRGGSAERRRATRRSCAGPAPCPRAHAPRAATRPRPTACPAASIDRAVGPGRAAAPRPARPVARASSANPPSPSGTSGPTRCGTPPSSSARCAAAGERHGAGCGVGAADVERLVDRLPAGAPAQVGGERAVEIDAAVPCLFARSAAARTTIPGVQKPHCDPPVATNAARRARPVRRRRGLRPS